jgi:hypothetical protein
MTAATARRRRSDAGAVKVTARDVAVVTWLGEMGVVVDEHLPVLLAGPAAPVLSERTARGWLARAELAGLVVRHRLLGRRWLVASRRGLRLAGLPYEVYEPSAWGLAHRHATNAVRLHVEAARPGVVWTSERAVRSRWAGSGARVRYADGLAAVDGHTAAVEVELSRKRPGEYADLLRVADPAVEAVWWFTPPGDQGWLTRTLEAVGVGPPCRVYPLPSGAVL